MGKIFHLGDILSVTTGRLLSPTKMSGVYEILNYMTQDDLFTTQLPRAAVECRPSLVKRYPWLEEIDDSDDIDWQASWKEWLADKVAKHGEYHEVEPISPEDHEVIDVISELLRMGVPAEKIIPVVMGE